MTDRENDQEEKREADRVRGRYEHINQDLPCPEKQKTSASNKIYMIQQTVRHILLEASVGVKGSMVFHTIFTDRTRSVSTLGAAFGEPGR